MGVKGFRKWLQNFDDFTYCPPSGYLVFKNGKLRAFCEIPGDILLRVQLFKSTRCGGDVSCMFIDKTFLTFLNSGGPYKTKRWADGPFFENGKPVPVTWNILSVPLVEKRYLPDICCEVANQKLRIGKGFKNAIC